ncbi:hypothetical protein [Gibbsiella quercinecans]|nr:hypothetical protein [Gibbsiella quercinecans]
MSIETVFYFGELPELTLTCDELSQVEFSSGTLFVYVCIATGWC